MGSSSPGHDENPTDQNMKFDINNILPQDSADILASLHQLSPLNINKLLTIESELVKLAKEYENDKEICDQIIQYYNKIKGYQKKKISYNENDSGPYTVIFESKNGRGLHPMDLGKRLHALKLSIRNISKKGFNRVGVTCNSFVDANKLLCNELLANEGYRVYVPQRFLTTKGIVRNIGFSVQEEDFLMEPKGSYKIIEARRLNRRVIENGNVSYTPSMTFLLTFEGKNRPNEIEIYSCPTKVLPYLPPVSQCEKCLRFGHKAKQCRSKIRCANCGANHPVSDCDQNTKCIYCHGDHVATSRGCKEFERQARINELMSFYDYSYYEASQIAPPLIPRNSNDKFQRTPQAFPKLTNSNNSVTDNRSQNPFSTPKNGHLYYQSSQPSQKRRKHVLIENPKVDMEEIRRATYPQPSRNASPNGVMLYHSSLQASPGHSSFSSPSPSYSSITSGEFNTPINNILVKPIIHSEPKNQHSELNNSPHLNRFHNNADTNQK